MMKEVEAGIDAPLDIKAGVAAISMYLTSMDSRTYKLGEEILVKGDGIRDFLALDRIQRINESRFAFEISYARGPL